MQNGDGYGRTHYCLENPVKRLWRALEAVCDPEIPVLSVVDLGWCGVDVSGDAAVVTITPTYSGCPAMAYIEMMVRDAVLGAGFNRAESRRCWHLPGQRTG